MKLETQPAPTIEQIDWQIDFIESLQRLNDGLQAVRGNIRPTDQIQNLLNEPGLGDELRALWSLLKELDTSFKLLPSIVNKADDRIDQVRQITAGADAITRMIRMFEQAETATAGAQVTDMSYLFKDVQALLPALKYVIEGFKLNPVIGAYLTVLGMALEQIAISVGQIEEAARIRNDLIKSERDLALGRDPAPTSTTPTEDPGLQQALDALKRQREELLAAANRAAMTDVTNARDLAYREHGVTQADVDARERTVEEAWRALRDAWEHRQVLEGQNLNANDRTALIEAEARLETVQIRRRRGGASEDEVTAALRAVDNIRQEQTRVAEAIKKADEALRTAYQEFTRARGLLQPILDSIRRTLTRYGKNQEWFRRYLPWYMDPNYWSLPAMRRIEAHLKVPSTVASADSALPNPFGNPLMLVAALGVIAIIALAGVVMLGGGDDDEVVGALVAGGVGSTVAGSATVTDATTTSAVAMETPIVSASSIVATFYPDLFTTEYVVEAFTTIDGGITYAWSGADCGESGTDSETPHIYEWYHPHPPCDATTDHSDRTIVVLVSSGGETLRCTYQGSHSGTGEACEPQ